MFSGTIRVVTRAGGWLARNRIINAPDVESESVAAMVLGQKMPGCSPNGNVTAPVNSNAA